MADNNNFEEENYQEDYTEDGDSFSNDYQDQPQKIGRGQKIAAISLAVFAVFVIILWMVQFKKSILSPLNPSTNPSPSDNSSLSATGNTASQNNQALKLKDTDNDGLSDWDELNIYHTSPYLADSDSDGVSDGAEVKNGTDPNCPIGRDCSAPIFNADANMSESASSTPSTSNQLNATQSSTQSQTPSLDLNVGTADQQTLQNALSGQSDADTLRQLLLQSGMDKSILDQISDEELMQSYQESLNKSATQPSGTSTGQ